MKVLIISYYSFPLNGVSSYRVDSFCKGFAQEGADVTLLTRHWEKSFNNWDDLLSSNTKAKEIKNENGYTVIRLPYHSSKEKSTSKINNKVRTLKKYITGHLHPEIEAFSNFKTYALALLNQETSFDLIIVSGPPNNLVRLAYHLHKKTGVPYVVDFRDFFNRHYILKSYPLTFNDHFIRWVSLFYLNKWLKKSTLITSVSPKFVTLCKRKFKKPSLLVANGYEGQYFQDRESLYCKNDFFTLRYIGTAYSHQDFLIIINGLKLFQEKHPEKHIKIELIGLHQKSVEVLFENNFTPSVLNIKRTRLEKKDTIEKIINSDLLMLPFNNTFSAYGTKLFEYIASGSQILLAPPDSGLVEDLIRKTDTGSICQSSEEVYNVMQEEYKKWSVDKNKSFDNHPIPEFSREKIAVTFYNFLKNLID